MEVNRYASLVRTGRVPLHQSEPNHEQGWSQRKLVTVVASLPEFGLVYADDDEQTRYLIDKDTVVETKPEHGQRLVAYVNDDGYVVQAKLYG